MSDIDQAVANLEAWLETMRTAAGYGGPVVHWWQNCLSYTGAGLDWRYEGIISGYLTLWRRTGQKQWLEKACRAGDDLLNGQLPAGNFRHSNFEQNPYAGGTPHEAAADLALLRLSQLLKDEGDPRWQSYAKAAERNLQAYYLDRLWDEEAQSFRDSPAVPSLVPNKACTLVEALFAWAELRGTDEALNRYALPALHAVLSLQVSGEGPLQGAIAQNHIKGQVVTAYFPYYIARCIPALLLAYRCTNEERWLASALAAGSFVSRQIDDAGLLPQVVYEHGENRCPHWIAPLGDVLRALDALTNFGFDYEKAGLQSAMLNGQLPSGGFRTGCGFGSQVNQRRPNGTLPDFRDNIPVAGWADKTFAYLAGRVPQGQPLPDALLTDLILECAVRGISATWQETTEEMTLTAKDGAEIYHWRKGESWAAVVGPEVMWK